MSTDPDRSDLFDRVATRIGDLDHPFYTEERDRDVWNEASAVGLQTLLGGLLLAGAVISWIGGSAGRPYALGAIVLAGIGGGITSAYALRRGVDGGAPEVLAASGRGRLTALALVLVVAAAGLLTGLARDGILDVPVVAGMVVGGAVGLGAAVVALWRQSRRAPAADPEDG